MAHTRKKIKLALFFGGRSAEHEVSIMSARNIYQALDREKYDVHLIGITESGSWITLDEQLLSSGTVSRVESATKQEKNSQALTLLEHHLTQDILTQDAKGRFDVIFPVLHGPFGEDGAFQGFCKIFDIPFVGPSVLGSAVGMDKDVMKRLLHEAGLPVAQAIVVKKHEDRPKFLAIQETLGFVVFVKPANLGSSVGVSRVTSAGEYERALDEAFIYDTKVLIEEAIEGREIECAVLGNEHPKASIAGEVIANHDEHTFYSYNAKYLDENGAAIAIPADITTEQMQEVQRLAVQVFKTLCCEGMGRVDFFLKKNGTFVVNEINTLPGFTSISMYPKLWEASGLSYSALIDELIVLAIERHQRDSALRTKV